MVALLKALMRSGHKCHSCPQLPHWLPLWQASAQSRTVRSKSRRKAKKSTARKRGRANRKPVSVPFNSTYLDGLVLFLELFSFLLSRKTRRQCFESEYLDLLKQRKNARKFRGKWARRGIAFAFTMRTLFMVADCLLGLLPESLHNWWRRQ